MPIRLAVIITSTRPGRAGLPVGRWVAQRASEHGAFEVDIVDLADVDLPFVDEPNHPRLREYTQAHTVAWSRRIDRADAFVFVLAEYNHGYPAAAKNAVDFLQHEWSFKPAAVVSYGGVSAGTRSLVTFRSVLVAVKAVPVNDAVNIPWISKHIRDGEFMPQDKQGAAARTMLDELERWSRALREFRSTVEAAPSA